MTYRKHFEIVERGLALHEDRRYARALPWFDKALSMCPGCPVAIYNRANTMHMLGKHEQAGAILRDFVATTDDTMRSACPDMAESPRSLRLDAYHLLFLSTLYATKSWKAAAPYLRQHLRQRTRGLRSLWSRAQVLRSAEALRGEFAPRAKPVADW